jgi:DNA-binding MarR family transcriptional regulator
MDYRNLNRQFIFNKALHLYNKNRPYSFSFPEVNVLLTIYHLQGSTGVKFADIANYLSSYYRSMALDVLIKKIQKFRTLNLVKSTGKAPVLYSLTVEGKNVLNELELKCRDTRYDK